MKGVNDAELSRVNAWHAIYLDSKGWASIAAYAKQAEIDAKKANKDTWSKATIEQQVSTIKWAVNNLLGGPKDWKSMAHIKASKKKPTKVVVVKTTKVGTVLVDTVRFDKWAKKNKVDSDLIKSFKSEFALR